MSTREYALSTDRPQVPVLIENPLNETIMLSVVGAVQAFSTASAEYVLEPYQVPHLAIRPRVSLGNDRQP